MLREPAKRDKQSTAKEEDRGHRGQVHEARDHYYVMTEGGPLAVSTFHLEPKQRVRTETGEVLVADIACRTGKRLTDVPFELEAFRSRKAFLRALSSADLQWFGTEENVQSVLASLSRPDLPTCQGTSTLGYLKRKEGTFWVSPDGVLTALTGARPTEELRYLPSGASLDKRVSYAPIAADRERELARAVLPRLLELNRPEVVLPILGWFFAAPLKPRIQERLGQFPILMVWGTQGSGKSTLIMEVFWRLMGLTSTEPYSATETEFALLKVLSATNAVPVFIDEYKPFDMPKHRRNTLHRLMRRLFKGETEERGRADQTVVTYRLDAPLCVAGETRPIESALCERILTANPAKDDLLEHPEYQRAFDAIRRLPLHQVAPGLIRFLLGRDTDADLENARRLLEQHLPSTEIPVRLRTNLQVMLLGLLHVQAYAAHVGAALPAFDIGAAIRAICSDLLEADGTAVKTALDLFLEELSVLAARGQILHGREYTDSNGRLALHFPSCHAAFAEHCHRIGYEGEVPDRKALRKQLEEAKRRKGYVLDIDAVITFNGVTDRRRAVLIDIEAAKAALAVDDFPRPAEGPGYWRGGAAAS